MTGFQLFWVNRDGRHRPLGYIYIHYILLNLSVLGLCLRINDRFLCLD